MSIKLVSDFSQSAYPYEFPFYLEDPEDDIEIEAVKELLKDATVDAGLNDYKIFESYGIVTVRVPTLEDLHKFTHALEAEDITETFFFYGKEHDYRKIKNAAHAWQRVINKSELLGSVQIEADRKAKALVLKAKDFFSYQQFYEIISGVAEFTPMP